MATTNEDERVVLLGTVQERQAVDDSSPYVCKAGGLPAWYKSDEPPQEANTLTCPKCQHTLFLVAQVYAPVDTDRTLYIFGCNSVDCTETPGSWRVLRDQSKTVDTAVAVGGDDEQQSQVGTSVPKSAWDAGSDGDSSDWGDNDDDESDPFAVAGSKSGGDDLIDLELLLLQRDDAMKLPASKPITQQQKKTTANAKGDPLPASSATGKSTSVFPAMPIDVIDEPYEDYLSENDYSHENALLDEYIKQEEEEKSTDVGDLRKVISSAKKNGGGGAAGSSSSGESYEKTPAQQRHFMRFQKRINRCPLQCLRYDYGGEPLWPVPKPQNVKIPKCVCGEARVFELQLTPTINYFLKVDQFAHTPIASHPPAASTTTDGDSKATAPPALKSAGGGMDWLSVTVYCCPKSCSRSREEFVHVLPAEKA
ncbi:hypothetical protein FI667_g2305, partial [Globisporangium splendens]